VGAKYASNDPKLLDHYSRDQSFTPPKRPTFVAMPENANQVREIVGLANKYLIPIIPYSSGLDFSGATIPVRGGILLDLRRMNRIVSIDTLNWFVTVEPGVTYLQLQKELEKHGLRVAAAAVPPSASVLSTNLERKPTLLAADFSYGNELIVSFDVILPSGAIFTVGNPALPGSPLAQPYGPGVNFFRLFQGAQGTLGVVTKMSLRCLPLPKFQKTFFMPFQKTSDALKTIQKIQRRQLGMECFALNSFNLASILLRLNQEEILKLKEGKYVGPYGAKCWNEDEKLQFENLRKKLSPWTVIINLAGLSRLPKEKVEYEEADLMEVAAELGITPKQTLEDLENAEEMIQETLIFPWRFQIKFGYKGSCHSLTFYSRISRVHEFEEIICNLAEKRQYPLSEIGGFLLPIERARAIYCEYDLHCNLNDPKDTENVRELFNEASEALIDKGAFFDTPYGIWAELIYRKTGKYTEYLRQIKKQFDMNNIMNPGKLCYA
jgi:hypothetical protein